jgi:hypothetical protein
MKGFIDTNAPGLHTPSQASWYLAASPPTFHSSFPMDPTQMRRAFAVSGLVVTLVFAVVTSAAAAVPDTFMLVPSSS